MVGLAGSLAVGPLASAAEPRPFRFEYGGPPECPTENYFVERVRAYAPSATRVNEPAPLDISVRIEPAAEGFVATIGARRSGQPEATRVMPAATCDELTQAAALFVAILVDPEAGRPAAPGPVTDAAPAAAPAPPPPVAPQRSEPRAPEAATGAPPTGDTSDAAGGFRAGAGLDAESTDAVAPKAAFGGGLRLHLESTDVSALSPWVSLGAQWLVSPEVAAGEGSVSFEVMTGRVTGCPVRARFAGTRLWMAPCGSFELGRLSATSDGVPRSGTATALWAALGLLSRIQVDAGPLFVGAEGGAVFPLVSDSFYFTPDRVTAFEVPGAALRATLGAGLSFR
jgi:hypothetical protein